MKTTLEIPDAIFRRAKSKAAEQGIPLRQFVTEAVEDKSRAPTRSGKKPWLKHAGKLRRLHQETVRINRLIEEDSEKIDRRIWLILNTNGLSADTRVGAHDHGLPVFEMVAGAPSNFVSVTLKGSL